MDPYVIHDDLLSFYQHLELHVYTNLYKDFWYIHTQYCDKNNVFFLLPNDLKEHLVYEHFYDIRILVQSPCIAAASFHSILKKDNNMFFFHFLISFV